MIAQNWRPVAKGALLGFVDFELPSGLILRGCTLMATTGRRWIGLPGRPRIDAEGRHLRDPASGKGLWVPVVEIPDPDTRVRFYSQALAAVDALLADGEPMPHAARGFGAREAGSTRKFPPLRASAYGRPPRSPPSDLPSKLLRRDDDRGAP